MKTSALRASHRSFVPSTGRTSDDDQTARHDQRSHGPLPELAGPGVMVAPVFRCPYCVWFKTPADKLAKAILTVHLRTEHGQR